MMIQLQKPLLISYLVYAVIELGGEGTVVSKHNGELIPTYHGGLVIGGLLPSL